MRRCNPVFLILFCLGGSAMARADTPPPAVPAIPRTQSLAFQFGYQLELPDAQAQLFIHDVEDLSNLSDESEIELQVGNLDSEAAQLRVTEASAYNRALVLAGTLGAPTDIKAWMQQNVDLLEQPVVISGDAARYAKSDPAAARVYATIDEADLLHSQEGDKEDSITLWMKLTSGSDALWARTVGSLTAAMYISLSQNDGLHHPTRTAADLVNSAPASTPLSVLRALRALAPPVDKIGPTDTMYLDPTIIQTSYTALTDAFVPDQSAPATPRAPGTAPDTNH